MSRRIPEKGAGSAYTLPGAEELREKHAEASKWFLSSDTVEARIEQLTKNGQDKTLEIDRRMDRIQPTKSYEQAQKLPKTQK